MARTVPVMAQGAPGNFLTAALWNANVKALGDYLTAPPVFRGFQTVAQTITSTSGTAVPILLDSESIDSDGGHSTTSNTSRYVVQVPGTYAVTGTVSYPTNATGVRGLQLWKNGALWMATQQQAPAANSAAVQIFDLITCNAGDYLEAATWQNSGGNLATNTGSFYSALSVLWVSK